MNKSNLNDRLVILATLGAAGIALLASEGTLKKFGEFQGITENIVILTTVLNFWTVIVYGWEMADGDERHEYANEFFKYTIYAYTVSALTGLLVWCFAPHTTFDRYILGRFGWVGYILFAVLLQALIHYSLPRLRNKRRKRKSLNG